MRLFFILFCFQLKIICIFVKKLIDMRKITVLDKHQMRQAFHRGGKIRRQTAPYNMFKMVNVLASHGYTNNWILTKNNEND